MADRTSAELFGMMFEKLASNPTDEHKVWALELFERTKNYDFNEYQMDADSALETLGLARKGVDPEYPDEGEVWIYGPNKSGSP